MATSIDRPREAEHRTQVADMPPVVVTTQGIPSTEHVAPTVVPREQRTRWYALIFMAVVAFLAICLLVANAIFGFWQAPTAAPTPGYAQWGSTMSEWPPRLTPSTDGYAQWGSTMSEWPPRLTPSTDGYAQWGSTMSEWPPRA